MASNLLSFHTIGVRASASGSGRRSSDTIPAANSKWWIPLFGWSSDPDYIDSKEEREADSARSKFAPGGFTEEKARRLRMMTTANQTFHDVMYHSSIASRLASDFSRRADR